MDICISLSFTIYIERVKKREQLCKQREECKVSKYACSSNTTCLQILSIGVALQFFGGRLDEWTCKFSFKNY